MQQINTRKIYALLLLSGALLQLTLLVASIIASFYLPIESGMQPQWSSYLLTGVLLGIAAVGVYQLRTQPETVPTSQRSSILIGLGLGVVAAISLSIPGLSMALSWAVIGLPMLIGVLIQDPAGIFSISPLFALISTAIYLVFAACYSLCAIQITRRNGSAKQGIWSSIQAAMATFLGTALTFTIIYTTTYFVFHLGSDIIAPSSIAGVSPLVNYIASYQDIVVKMTAFWLLTPVILGLLIAFVSASISRHTTQQPTIAPTNL